MSNKYNKWHTILKKKAGAVSTQNKKQLEYFEYDQN